MGTEATGVDAQAGAEAVRALLRACGVDPSDSLLAGTPQRVAATFAELFTGVGQDETAPLRRGDSVPEGMELVALNDIEFRSVCVHHLLPFSGTVSVVYSPVERIVGIGSIIRTLDVLSSRPQLQEQLTHQLAEAIVTGAGASGALVVMQARHSCIADRGPREAESSLRTVAASGDLVEGDKRWEALQAAHA